MNPNLWLDQQARLFTASDSDIFRSICESLPIDPEACPGCEAHSYPAMRRFVSDAGFPTGLLEIGFNQGRSAMFWGLYGRIEKLVSVDIKSRPSHIKAVFEVCQRNGVDFRFIHGQSGGIDKSDVGDGFTAAFVDGDHTKAGILADIETCRRIGITDILFDDWLPQYGETQEALQESNLRLVWVAGNMAYCRDDRSDFR